MRRLSVCLALIALLAGLCAVHTWYLDRLTGELSAQLTRAQKLAGEGDWAGAAQLTRQAREQWRRREGYLHITLRHADTDAIQLSMDEALAFLEGAEKQSAEYAAANARLLGRLELLAEEERPTLANVL